MIKAGAFILVLVYQAARGGQVPGNALGTVEQFMNMMMMKAAKDLQVDPTITK